MKSATAVMVLSLCIGAAQAADLNPYAFDPKHPGEVLTWDGEPGNSDLYFHPCGKTNRGLQCSGGQNIKVNELLDYPRLRVVRRFPDMTHCKPMTYGYKLMQIQNGGTAGKENLKTDERGKNPVIIFLKCLKETPGIRVLYWSDFPEDFAFPAGDAVEEERRVMSVLFPSRGGIAPMRH